MSAILYAHPPVQPQSGTISVPHELLEMVKILLADYLARATWDSLDQAALDAVDALLAGKS